jgi:photosystem II stability/assembly factor-like uncharacterized protein
MRQLVALLLTCWATAYTATAQEWINHPSGSAASLRGVSTVNASVIWASGSGGTYLQSTDGGANWHRATVPAAEQLDFRDVHAIDDRTAYLLSSGTGDKSRIYKTTNGGRQWLLQFTNPDASGFLDAFAFWDQRAGIVLGDPVGGEFVILTTDDGGAHWQRQHTPAALPKEGAFAASGTSLIARGKHECWFATGGPGAARVFHSKDAGRSWIVSTTPLAKDAATAGIFSLAFRDARHGVAVGGDYAKLTDTTHNIAITSDGGRTWSEPQGKHPNGYRSAVAFVPRLRFWIAVGPSGSDISYDDGASWKNFTFYTGAYNAISFAPSGDGWAVGPDGRLGEFRWLARTKP